MMYSATLLASLLASAHGFASTPPNEEKFFVECSANEEKFFVYSTDPSLIYPFVASFGAAAGAPDVTAAESVVAVVGEGSAAGSVTHGLVGKTWQGVQLSITQGNTIITQAGGKPLTVTSPNTLASDLVGGFNVVSEDFCLGPGEWTVKATASTHPKMASYKSGDRPYNSMEERLASYEAGSLPVNDEPILSLEVVDFGINFLETDPNNMNANSACDESNHIECDVYRPFQVRWAIFPAEMRANATAAAGKGLRGMAFIEDHYLQRGLSFCETNFNKVVSVPAPDHTCWDYDYHSRPCPRPPSPPPSPSPPPPSPPSPPSPPPPSPSPPPVPPPSPPPPSPSPPPPPSPPPSTSSPPHRVTAAAELPPIQQPA